MARISVELQAELDSVRKRNDEMKEDLVKAERSFQNQVRTFLMMRCTLRVEASANMSPLRASVNKLWTISNLNERSELFTAII